MTTSYLADVFEKPDGWIETPEADPDADAKLVSQSVYAADCEMVRPKLRTRLSYANKDKYQCLTEDGKALTRLVSSTLLRARSYMDYSSNHRVRSQIISLSGFHCLWLFTLHLTIFQLFRHDGSSPWTYNHDA